jgi:predicted MPP superfamily phosphohydrolase
MPSARTMSRLKPTQQPPAGGMSRRTFLKRAALAAVTFAGAASLYTLAEEPSWLTVYRVRAPIPSLPPALDGFTIGQLSDLHFGRYVPAAHVRRASEMLAALQPDLTVLTGDFVWGGADAGHIDREALAPLQGRHGIYASLGNHDYWSTDAPGITRTLTDLGIGVLVNASTRLRVAGLDWWLCAVDDVWAGKPDLDAALRGVPPDAFRLFLCHEPDYADKAAARGIPLQLSGHSHGGQVRLPLIGAPMLPPLAHKYPIGLQRIGTTDSFVYTNVGVGVTAPVRFRCRPEVTLMTLTQDAG